MIFDFQTSIAEEVSKWVRPLSADERRDCRETRLPRDLPRKDFNPNGSAPAPKRRGFPPLVPLLSSGLGSALAPKRRGLKRVKPVQVSAVIGGECPRPEMKGE
jgi:hypothetical protein